MRHGVRALLLAGALVSTLAAAGCSEGDDPPPRSEESESSGPTPTYDPELEASAGVLVLVPDGATTLTVTDYHQLRLQLGMPELTSSDPAPERAEFWRRVEAETAAIDEGLLRPVEARLARRPYGFTQDDVVWEAHFSGKGVEGWVLKFRDDLRMQGVQRAVDDGIGPLGGARVATEQKVIGVGVAGDPAQSWAADEELVALVGAPAAATYLERGCIEFDDAYGEGMRDQLADDPSADVGRLEELDAYSIAFGSVLATARLGPERSDVFERARLADALPETDPSFGTGFGRPVADPSTGRIGYSLDDPRAAVRLTLDRRLAFALCADD